MSFAYSPSPVVCRNRQWRRFIFHLILAISCLLAVSQASRAQSTFGTVLGTVRDPSGSVVPMAKVDLLNTGTNVARSTLARSDGAYEFVNVDVGNYKLRAEATGFQAAEFQPFDLTARATVR